MTTTLMKAIAAPLRKGEIVEVRRAGDWTNIILDTPMRINVDQPTMLNRIKAAIDILRHGYHDTEKQKAVLVLHHIYASELNDLLIESIYYTPDGEYKGEQFTYRDT